MWESENGAWMRVKGYGECEDGCEQRAGGSRTDERGRGGRMVQGAGSWVQAGVEEDRPGPLPVYD